MLISGCERWGEIYTISGTLYKDCSMTPYAGGKLELFIWTWQLAQKHGGTVDVVTTDSSGWFTLSYQYMKGVYGVRGSTIFLPQTEFNFNFY